MKFVRYVFTAVLLVLGCAGTVCAKVAVPFAKIGNASSQQYQQRYPKEVVEEIPGKIENWVDGDTCVFIPDSDPDEKIRVRLWLVDAPELDQPGGKEARNYMKYHHEIGDKKLVILGKVGIDQYKRTLGELKGRYARDYVTAELLASGYLWPIYPALQHDISQERADQLEKIFNTTRAMRKGIFRDDNAVPPYLWRKKSKEEKDRIRTESERKTLGSGYHLR